MKKQVSIIWVIISITLILLLVLLIGYIYRQQSEINNIKEQISIEKEREKLEEEYSAIFQEYREYENYENWVSNDTLVSRLNKEKLRVQRLLEELRTRKDFNIETIDSLQNELKKLRGSIRIYQSTIDSLNQKNRQLQAEKEEVMSRYQKASREAVQLQKDNDELSEKVNLAAQLEATDLVIDTYNKRGRKSDDPDKVTRIKVNFTIARNITATKGEKRIYLCLKKPNGSTLVKDRSNTFVFDGKEHYYSMQQIIDYTGNAEKMYFTWKIEEYMTAGTYAVEIFADNQLIGTGKFTLNN